ACPQNHIIAARGSLEPPGPGSLITLAEKVMQQNPGTTMDSIVYPATIENYDVSSTAGTAAVEQQLSTFVQKCPSSKVVMMGFSQGAQIVGDALGGGGIQGISKSSAPVGRAFSSQVTAVVMYGDPRHVVQAPFNVGTATKDGIFPRSMNQTLNAFAAMTKAFCNDRDPFCASGDELAVHLAYPREFDTMAAAFVTSRLQG
ncbi:alpha/beta-hydrolase, partial [Tothia fuscella]